jgi:putative cell wall-binding protein
MLIRSRSAAVVAAALLVALLLPTARVGAAAQDRTAEQPADAPVQRIAGADRVTTAVAVSRAGWTTSHVVVLATAADFADALSATALAARADAPLLLTWRDELPDATARELQRLRTAEVVILGGEAAVSARVADRLASLPGRPAVRRVSGPDRYATAVAAARDGRSSASEVLIASGVQFADAVAAGALATSLGNPPVLLTRQAGLHQVSRQGVTDLSARQATLAGGTAALSDQVAADLSAQGVDPTRLAGADRYATSRALADAALARMSTAGRPLVVATGDSFPDALASGALAAQLGGVLLLVPRSRLPDATDAFVRERRARFDRVVVVGGTSAIDLLVERELAAAMTDDPRPFAAIRTAAGFAGSASALPAAVRSDMTGASWRAGCPVALDDLALLRLRYRTFDGGSAEGELVTASRIAGDVLAAFAQAYDAGFPIERLQRIDAYDGDDDASMAANNTSAFNCRTVAGTTRWSEHAYGTAIDINPVQNPYVRAGRVDPPTGEAYLDRSDVRPGMLVEGDAVVRAFTSLGWGWGGSWQTSRDYMHVSESGR